MTKLTSNLIFFKNKIIYSIILTLAGTFFSVKDESMGAIFAIMLMISLKLISSLFSSDLHKEDFISKYIFIYIILIFSVLFHFVLYQGKNSGIANSIILFTAVNIYSSLLFTLFEKCGYSPKLHGCGLFILIIFLLFSEILFSLPHSPLILCAVILCDLLIMSMTIRKFR